MYGTTEYVSPWEEILPFLKVKVMVKVRDRRMLLAKSYQTIKPHPNPVDQVISTSHA
jgi:hypothetical protein